MAVRFTLDAESRMDRLPDVPSETTTLMGTLSSAPSPDIVPLTRLRGLMPKVAVRERFEMDK